MLPETVAATGAVVATVTTAVATVTTVAMTTGHGVAREEEVAMADGTTAGHGDGMIGGMIEGDRDGMTVGLGMIGVSVWGECTS